jgi:DNA-binding protein H-NS
MPRPANLSKLSVEELVRMRNDISGVLSSKAALLRKELAFLGESVAAASRALMPKKRGSLAGTKVPAKYRGPKGELWAGRGAEPLWMRDAIKKDEGRKEGETRAAGEEEGCLTVARRRSQ